MLAYKEDYLFSDDYRTSSIQSTIYELSNLSLLKFLSLQLLLTSMNNFKVNLLEFHLSTKPLYSFELTPSQA